MKHFPQISFSSRFAGSEQGAFPSHGLARKQQSEPDSALGRAGGRQRRKPSPLPAETRAGQNPRSRKARPPGPTPPSSLPRILPVGIAALQTAGPGPSLPPSPPGETRAQQLTAVGRAPLLLPRLSELGKHPAPLQKTGTASSRAPGSPATSATPPAHFRPVPGPNLAFRGAHFRSAPAGDQDGIPVRRLPPRRRRLGRFVPLSLALEPPAAPGALKRIVFRLGCASPVLPHSRCCAPMKSDAYDAFLRVNRAVRSCFREELRRRCSLPVEGFSFLPGDGGGGGAALGAGEAAVR